MMVVNPFGQGAYDRYPLCMAQQNKAKQSQFDAPFGSERGPGAEQPLTAAHQFKILFENVLCTLLKFLIYIDAPLDLEFQA